LTKTSTGIPGTSPDIAEAGNLFRRHRNADRRRARRAAAPGIVFELKNAEGRTMLSPCVAQVPAKPFDWKSPPVMFRAVDAPKPQRSTPMPPPKNR